MLSKLVKYLPLSITDRFTQKGMSIKKLKSFVENSSPGDLEYLSEKKLLAAFHRAAENIPYYKKFLEEKKIDHKKIKTYEDFNEHVPVITKESYVKKVNTIADLCIGGDLGNSTFLARSSGYTGKSCTWAKGREEQEESKKMVGLGMDILYNSEEKSTLFIISFSLGSWVSGVDLLLVGDTNCSVVAPGSDMDETLSIFSDLAPEFDQVVIGAVPSFLKNLVEYGNEKRVGWKNHDVHLLVGAEPITEEWRDYIKMQLGSKKARVFSAYGTSDMGITGVNETPQSAYIRKLAMKNEKMKNEIFGKYAAAEPMLFQYDPTKFYIETNDKDELIFSNCDQKSFMPLMRYNIKDIGYVIPHNEMKEILKKNGVKFKLRYPTPFVFVVGRSDGTISYIGQEIYPQYIEESVYKDQWVTKKVTDAFKIYQSHDKKHNPLFNVDMQLRKGEKPDIRLARKIAKNIEEYFYALSSDFGLSMGVVKKRTNVDLIRIHLYEFDKYPHQDKLKVHHI